jgi:hypothetical protein
MKGSHIGWLIPVLGNVIAGGYWLYTLGLGVPYGHIAGITPASWPALVIAAFSSVFGIATIILSRPGSDHDF